jgi:hypothetical protein
MELVEAVNYLRERRQEDPELRIMLAAMIERAGFVDLFDWADAHPDMAVALAEQAMDADEQFSEFERRLSTGDLS